VKTKTKIRRSGLARRGWSMKTESGNVVSIAHQSLTEWGDRYYSLGTPSIGPCGRIAEEGAVGASVQPEGLHGDPTLANQVRDESLYLTNRAVRALQEHNEDMARAVVGFYVQGMDEAKLARHMGRPNREISSLLHASRCWVGSWLEKQRAKTG